MVPSQAGRHGKRRRQSGRQRQVRFVFGGKVDDDARAERHRQPKEEASLVVLDGKRVAKRGYKGGPSDAPQPGTTTGRGRSLIDRGAGRLRHTGSETPDAWCNDQVLRCGKLSASLDFAGCYTTNGAT